MSASGPQSPPDDALLDLLIKQVTEGLSSAEQRALDVLDSATASRYHRDFERAAAAITLAGSPGAGSSDAMPAMLRKRLEAEADSFASTTAGSGAAVGDLAAARARASERAPPATPARRAGTGGWYAAAACLLLAIAGWLRAPAPVVAPPTADVQVPAAVVPPPLVPEPPPTPEAARAGLLARAETLKLALGATKDPAAAGVTGDVVWDPATQRGFLHFVGLTPNDPHVHQYQLWIFDGKRDKRYPVDGGVFDVPADATEVFIPIHAAVPVLAAQAFAVTVEKPGGTVVSGREHIVVLGQVVS